MRFPVGGQATDVADVLWETVKSNKSDNIRPDALPAAAEEKPQTLES